MVKIQCIGRRRLDITKLMDGNYQVEIRLTGKETLIATLVIPPKEFEKVKDALQEA